MTVKELIKHLENMPGHLHVVCNAGPIRKLGYLPVRDWRHGEKERGIVVLKSASELRHEIEVDVESQKTLLGLGY